MGSEEVLSVLAGFHARPKRRLGHDRITLRQYPGRKAQKNAAKHAAAYNTNTSHGMPRPSNQRRYNQIQANVVAAGGTGRLANHDSSIGTGGMGTGDGNVGHAVHLAAVESVEAFLGDFVPAHTPAVAALLSATTRPEDGGKTSAEAHGGGDGAMPKKASKWAAIGRAGKISARATAVCVEEVSGEDWLLGCSPFCVLGVCCSQKQRNRNNVTENLIDVNGHCHESYHNVDRSVLFGHFCRPTSQA